MKSLARRRAHGRILRMLHPGFSWCFRCLTPWSNTKGHSTEYSETGGCFPLCETCWAELTPEERMPYYDELIAGWFQMGCPIEPENAAAIRRAVRAGK